VAVELTDAEIRERMSWQHLPLRRLPQHRGRHQTGGGNIDMKAFSYQRPETAEHAAAAAVRPGAKLIAGGTNLLDLMKLQVETLQGWSTSTACHSKRSKTPPMAACASER